MLHEDNTLSITGAMVMLAFFGIATAWAPIAKDAANTEEQLGYCEVERDTAITAKDEAVHEARYARNQRDILARRQQNVEVWLKEADARQEGLRSALATAAVEIHDLQARSVPTALALSAPAKPVAKKPAKPQKKKRLPPAEKEDTLWALLKPYL
jgi:hypothetical protein